MLNVLCSQEQKPAESNGPESTWRTIHHSLCDPVSDCKLYKKHRSALYGSLNLLSLGPTTFTYLQLLSKHLKHNFFLVISQQIRTFLQQYFKRYQSCDLYSYEGMKVPFMAAMCFFSEVSHPPQMF